MSLNSWKYDPDMSNHGMPLGESRMSGEDIRFMTDDEYRKIDLEKAMREGKRTGLTGRSLRQHLDVKLAFREFDMLLLRYAIARLICLLEEELDERNMDC